MPKQDKRWVLVLLPAKDRAYAGMGHKQGSHRRRLTVECVFGPRSCLGGIEGAEYTAAYPAHGKQVPLGSLRSGDFLMNASGI